MVLGVRWGFWLEGEPGWSLDGEVRAIGQAGPSFALSQGHFGGPNRRIAMQRFRALFWLSFGLHLGTPNPFSAKPPPY